VISNTLTTNELPTHSHTGTTSFDGLHSHTGTANVKTIRNNMDAGGLYDVYYKSTVITTDPVIYSTISPTGSHQHTFTTQNAGSGTAFDNMQPYITLIYIIKYDDPSYIQTPTVLENYKHTSASENYKHTSASENYKHTSASENYKHTTALENYSPYFGVF
jgi:hypothetical protein